MSMRQGFIHLRLHIKYGEGSEQNNGTLYVVGMGKYYQTKLNVTFKIISDVFGSHWGFAEVRI